MTPVSRRVAGTRWSTVLATGLGALLTAAPAVALPTRVHDAPSASLEHPDPDPAWTLDDEPPAGAGLATKDVELLMQLHHFQQRQMGHARLAQRRARSKAVRTFSARVMRQSVEADRRVMIFLHRRHVALGGALVPMMPHFAIPETLLSTSGSGFDSELLRVLIDEQSHGLTMLERGREAAVDQGLKRLAAELTRPLVRQRREAQALLRRTPGTDPRRRADGRAEAIR